MKKSSQVTLGLVATAAMVMTACNRTETRRCVDGDNRVVDDFNCEPSSTPLALGTSRGFYRWYYGGRGFNNGETAYDGMYVPTPGRTVVSRGGAGVEGGAAHGSVSRGGFGAHGAAHGSGS